MIFNLKYKTKPIIAHNPLLHTKNKLWDKLLYYKNSIKCKLPNNLTIITWNNNIQKELLELQLDELKINYICLSKKENWNSNRIKITSFLKNYNLIKTKYVLGMDCYDVIVCGDLINILNEFKLLNCKLLFNATGHNYPLIDEYEVKDIKICDHPPFQFLNSGVFIGEASYIKNYFEQALQYKDEFTDQFPQSDQCILKPIYHKLYPEIQIDWKCNLFQVIFLDRNNQPKYAKVNYDINEYVEIKQPLFL